MEIITGAERRRRWRIEDKLRILTEARQSSTAAVARRYEVSRALLYQWRRQFQEGQVSESTGPRFIPLQIVGDATPATSTPREVLSPTAPARARRKGMMEIDLGSERRIRVGRDVDSEALRRVIAALAPR